MDTPESSGAPPAEAALDATLQRWSVGLAVPLGTAARIVPGGWQCLPVSDWLALGPDWALGALKISWHGGAGTALVGMPRGDLARLSGLEGDAASENPPDVVTRLWNGLLDVGAGAIAAARDTSGGSLGCEAAGSRVIWNQEELGDLAGEALAGELLISACTVQPEGREFAVALHVGVPPALLEALAPAVAPTPVAAPAARGPVVAVVAFDPRLRRELRDAARALQQEVVEFADAREYLQSRVVRRTSLLLLGVCLENRTTLQHCRALRQEPRLKDVPLLMCAPTATRDLLLEAISAGAHGFAVAPFSESVPRQVKKIREAA
jgi:CheY-like chemotaxis protein